MQLRNYGSERKYYNDIIGFNNRLDDMQAIFLNVKLEYLKQMNTHRNKLAKMYFDNLKSDFILPVQDADFYDVFHIFNIRHKKRDELQQYLTEKGNWNSYPLPGTTTQAKSINRCAGDRKALPYR